MARAAERRSRPAIEVHPDPDMPDDGAQIAAPES